MLLRQMRYFMEVVDRGSFTQAAEACFISQSAISQQIKALEEELGAQLLLREGRRFSLTPAGEYFYRQGKVVLEELDRVCRETHHRASRTERLLRVAYPGNYAGQELHRAVAAFPPGTRGRWSRRSAAPTRSCTTCSGLMGRIW